MKWINDRLETGLVTSYQNFVYFTGQYYGMETTASSINSNTSLGSNTMIMTYFTTPIELEIDRIGFINNATGASNGKCFIYIDDFETTGNYLPSILEYEGTSKDLSVDTTFKEDTMSYTFYPGRVYWIGVLVSALIAIRRLVVGGSPSLGTSSGTANPANSLSYTHTYASALPTTLTQSSLSVTTPNPPNVRFRAV
jgi:hypothetical protein